MPNYLKSFSNNERDMSLRMRAACERERAVMYTLKGSLTLSIDDSFSPSWAAHDSDIWPHGRHRFVGCCLRLAGRF